MSSTTWTPVAVASESGAALREHSRPWRGRLWRAVEAQHRVSTLRLVDSLSEQAQLEDLLESSKPALPATRLSLHYLLTTPFRYPPHHPGGSRFRSATDAGVFYGADARRTACAELGYWRWRFLTDSPALPRLESVPHTLFYCEASGSTLDLTREPFRGDAARWMAPNDYSACQKLGAEARQAGMEMIRYASVRDPEHELCTAALTPQVFTPRPLEEQTWRLAVTRQRILWQRESVLFDESFEFAAGPGPAG